VNLRIAVKSIKAIYIDSSDGLEGEEDHGVVEDVPEEIIVPYRPQRNRQAPSKLNDCEIIPDNTMNDEGDLIHFALLADSGPINYKEALKSDEETSIICLYVDDLLITSSSTSKIKKVKEKLKSEFEMTDLGEISFFLGMEFVKLKNEMMMHQQKYIGELLEKFEMKN